MEVEDRYLVYDGDLVELNQDDYTAMQRVHAYLLNDSLMIAAWLSDRWDLSLYVKLTSTINNLAKGFGQCK